MIIFADVTFSTEGMVVITGLLVSLIGAITFLFKLYAASKDAQIAEMKSQRDVYFEMVKEANSALESKIDEIFKITSKKMVKRVVPVVPEHSSPVTQAQIDTANMQTERARLTASTLALGLPPRDCVELDGKSKAHTVDSVGISDPSKTIEIVDNKLSAKTS